LRFYDALVKLRNLEPAYRSLPSGAQQGIFYQALATVFSFNGMPDSAINAWDKGRTKGTLLQEKVVLLIPLILMDTMQYLPNRTSWSALPTLRR